MKIIVQFLQLLRRIAEGPLLALHWNEAQPELPEPGEVVEDGQQDEGRQVAGDRPPGVPHLNRGFSPAIIKVGITSLVHSHFTPG